MIRPALALAAGLLLAMAASARAQAPPAPAPADSSEPPPAATPFVTEAPAEEPSSEPPLHLSADNMTGGRGPEGDVVFLNGHVRITRERTVLTADAGRYIRAQGMLFLDGRVKMVDTTTTVTCDHASYSEKTDLLQLEGQVVIVDREAELRAPRGTYDRRLGRADLEGGVEGRDKQQRLFCDRAVYVRDSLLVQARGNVRGLDEEHRLELDGPAVDYHRGTHLAVATGDPVLRSKDGDGRETRIRATRLLLNTETRTAEAIDSVRVERDTLQARADYARFEDLEDRGILLGHPRAWDNETVVTGDTMEVRTEKRALRRVLVRGNAVMDYKGARPNNAGEQSRLQGSLAEVFFSNDKIDSLVATGKARNEYQGVPQAKKTPERNVAEGDTITVYFKDRKIERARVMGEAKGEYHAAVAEGDTTAAKAEVVRYDALAIEFVVPKNRIVLDEQAHLTYRELELNARRVEFDSEKQTLVAEGNPQLVDRGDKVSGHLMTYDLESRTGTIYQAETQYERGLYHGERIRKAGENVLDVMNGSYSTCDLAEPHYHFQAHWMKIYLKDKLVAKPIVFYVKHVPLLALPFYVFPIKPGRHSGFLFPQFEFGFNNRAGQFLRNAGYYWAANDFMDFTAAGDYYQRDPSWVLRGEGVYKLLYVLDGYFRGTYAKNEDPERKREDWSFTADHNQEVTPRTRLSAHADFVSSRDFAQGEDFAQSLAQRLNRFLTSTLALTHTADWASFSAALDRRQDLDADRSVEDPDGEGPLHGRALGSVASLPNLTETTPSVSVSFPTRTLGSLAMIKGTPFAKPLASVYASFNSRFLSQRTRSAFVSGYRTFTRDTVTDSTTTIDQQVSTRRALASFASLSDSRRLFGWINLSPRLSANTVVFDFDELGNRVVPTGTWSGDVGTSATFYGLFRPRIPGLVGLRHIVVPSVSYSYSPEFKNLTFVDSAGVRRERFRGFGGIGVSGFKNSQMSFSLDQRFQAKIRRGDKVERLDNLMSLTSSGSYNLLWRELGLAHGLSPIGSSLRVTPPGVVSGDLSWTTDPYQGRPVRALNYNVGLNLAGKGGAPRSAVPELPVDAPADAGSAFRETWSLGVAYSYAGGYQSLPHWTSAQTANGVLRYQFSPGWDFNYSASYDVTNRDLLTQRFGLVRDLHCWRASFTRSLSVGGQAEYYFRIEIKDQKEIYLERGTRVQSLGGIQ